MLDYNILNKKSVTTTINGKEKNTFIDLLSNSFQKDMKTMEQPVIVTEDYVARPDLISLAVYGDDRYADIICKYNGISNPFELNKDMVLFCPTVDYVTNCTLNTDNRPSTLIYNKATVDGNINSNGTLKSKYHNIGDDKKLSNETIEQSKINSKKTKNERRTPSEPTINDQNYVVDKTLGIVIY